jgi:hypothetical protein
MQTERYQKTVLSLWHFLNHDIQFDIFTFYFSFQAAFMVPTEVLAVQHYEHLTSLLDKFDADDKPNIALLTGSTSTRESRMIRNASCPPYSFYSL